VGSSIYIFPTLASAILICLAYFIEEHVFTEMLQTHWFWLWGNGASLFLRKAKLYSWSMVAWQ